MSSQAAVSVSSVSFTYVRKPALRDLTFTLKAGHYYALLGPNGAGKSTLMALLCQLLRGQSGQIAIDGHDLQSNSRAALRSLGVVFQQSTLDVDLTVTQNLAYHASLHGLGARTAARRIDAELHRFELQDMQHARIRTLNGGHRRRVEIARALLHQPSVLLLDEATVGLDIPTRAAINLHVRTLCQQTGITVLSSTHLMDEVTESDHLLVLNQGRLLLDLPCSQAFKTHQTRSVASLYQTITGPVEVSP